MTTVKRACIRGLHVWWSLGLCFAVGCGDDTSTDAHGGSSGAAGAGGSGGTSGAGATGGSSTSGGSGGTSGGTGGSAGLGGSGGSGGTAVAGGCGTPLAVTVADDSIDCMNPRFLCVDSENPSVGFATIQPAVDAATPGQVVAVFGSTSGASREYDGFAVVGDGNGSDGGTANDASSRVIIKAVGNVLLTRAADGSIDAPILIQDVDYVTVDGFQVDRTSTPGTVTSSYAHSGVRVTDTDWRDTRPSFGVHLVNLDVRMGSPANLYVANVGDVVVERCHFSDSQISDGYSNGGGMHLYLANGPTDNAVVRCNVFDNAVAMSIHSNGDDDLIEGQLFEYNLFRNSAGHGIHFQDARRVTIRYNLFVDVQRSGVTAWGINYPPESFIIHNNLFFRTTLGGSPSPVQLGTETFPEDLGDHSVFNNLFVGNAAGNDITVHGTTVTLTSNLDELGNEVSLDPATTLAGDPSIFVDPANDDFRFAQPANRAAVNDQGAVDVVSPQGTQVDVPGYDYAGTPVGGSVSVGPYEY